MTFIGMLIEGHAYWCGTVWAFLDDQGENSKGHLEVISRLIVNQSLSCVYFCRILFFHHYLLLDPKSMWRGFQRFCFGVQRFIPMTWLWSLIFNVLNFLCMFSCATFWVIDNFVDLAMFPLHEVSVNRVIISLHERERLRNDVVFIWSHIPLRENYGWVSHFWCASSHFCVNSGTFALTHLLALLLMKIRKLFCNIKKTLLHQWFKFYFFCNSEEALLWWPNKPQQ
jgi:hypothetical protein